MAVSSSTDTERWYSQGHRQIYDTLSTDSDGLSTEEASTRLSEYGPNRLPQAKPVSVWQMFVRQFKNPLIYILGLAAIVSCAIGEETDAGFIAVAIELHKSSWKARYPPRSETEGQAPSKTPEKET